MAMTESAHHLLDTSHTWTNLFRASRTFARVSFRVYTSLTKECELYEAELDLVRKCANSPTVYVHATENELYVFWLGTISPSDPDPRWNLTELSTGVFLASTVTQAVSTGAGVPSQYTALVNALKKHILNSIVQCTPPTATEFFFLGDRLVTADGLHFLCVNPSITPKGDLVFLLYYEQAHLLHSASNESEDSALDSEVDFIPGTTKLWLSPSGTPATFLKLTECPVDWSNLQDILAERLCFSGPAMDYSTLQWLEVTLCDGGRTVLWPKDLCFIEKCSQSVTLPKSAALAAQSSDLQTASFQELIKWEVASITEALAIANARTEISSQLVSQSQNPARRASLVYPTPPDHKGRNGAINSATAMGTGETLQSSESNVVTSVADAWGMEDFEENEEITEADFNFFDEPEDENEVAIEPQDIEMQDAEPEPEPEPSSQLPVKRKLENTDSLSSGRTSPSPSSSSESSESTTPPVFPQLDTSDLNRGSILEPVEGDGSTLFSAINFNPLIGTGVDSKYSQGGRFFAKHIDTEVSEDDEIEAKSLTTHRVPLPSQESFPITMHTATWRDLVMNRARRGDNLSRLSTTIPHSSTMEIHRTSSIYDPACMRRMLEQIVWDHRSLSNFFANSNASAIREAPDTTSLLTSLQASLSELEPTKLDDILKCGSSECLQQPAAESSDLATPYTMQDLDGQGQSRQSDTTVANSTVTNTNTNKTQHPRSNTNEILHIESPLFALCRLNHLMKARPTIIEFWRTLGLSPKSGPKNITVAIIVPPLRGIQHAALLLLSLLKSAYVGCELGSFEYLDEALASARGETVSATGSDPSTSVIVSNPDDHKSKAVFQRLEYAVMELSRPTNKPTIGLGQLPVPPLSQDGSSSIERHLVVLNALEDTDSFALMAGVMVQLDATLLNYMSPIPMGPQNSKTGVEYFRPLRSLAWQAIGLSQMYMPEAPKTMSQRDMAMLALAIYDKCAPSSTENMLGRINSATSTNMSLMGATAGTANGSTMEGGTANSPGTSLSHSHVQTPQGVGAVLPMNSAVRLSISPSPGSVGGNVGDNGAKGTGPGQPGEGRANDYLSMSVYSMHYSAILQTAPAFALARTPPSKIAFKARTVAPDHLMDEDSLLHVCYSTSPNFDWVTAAWSDQWGEFSMVDGFCLKPPNSHRVRGLEEILSEIWERTQGFAARRDSRWRVILAKVGGRLTPSELASWIRLTEHNKGSSNAGASLLYIVNIDTSPEFLIGTNARQTAAMFPYERLCMAEAAKQSEDAKEISNKSASATPITPRAGGTLDENSPDISLHYAGNGSSAMSNGAQHHAGPVRMAGSTDSNPGTVGVVDNDSIHDCVIEDGIQDTFGITIVDESINLIGYPDAEHAKPLAIGLLVQPGIGGCENSGNIFCETEECQGVPSPGRQAGACRTISVTISHSCAPNVNMKALLTQYSRLASLGYYRGVNGPDQACIPWHASACLKMGRALTNMT